MWMLAKIVTFSLILSSILGLHIKNIDSGNIDVEDKTKKEEHLIQMTNGERQILEVSVKTKKVL